MAPYLKPLSLSSLTLCALFLVACGSSGVNPITDEPDEPSAALLEIGNPDNEPVPPDSQPSSPDPSDLDLDLDAAPAPAPAQPSLPEPDNSLSCSASAIEFEATFLHLMNEARAVPRQCGSTTHDAAPSLKWNQQLYSAALSHSMDMTTNDFFDHTGSDNLNVQDRVDATGYAWQAVGENIAAGQRSAEEVVKGWIDSPGHCRNIMNPDYEDVAVTCVKDSSAKFTNYWTNVFGAEF